MVAPTTALPSAAQPTAPSAAASAKAPADQAATAAPDAIAQARKAAEARPEGQRNTLNAQILEASLQVSVQAGNQSMALLYRTAIDSINEYLEPELGPDAIGQAMAQNQDHSAEATAGRILSQSTAFFDAYAAQHQGEDPEQVARNFVALIRGGFEQGFGEAEDILQGLGVLEEGSPIAAGIQKTYALVQKGYDDFLAQKLEALRNPPQASAPSDTSTSTNTTDTDTSTDSNPAQA